MVVHTCNPSTLEAEARSLLVQYKPALHSELQASQDYITWHHQQQQKKILYFICSEDNL
jgi:hypothetical protein